MEEILESEQRQSEVLRSIIDCELRRGDGGAAASDDDGGSGIPGVVALIVGSRERTSTAVEKLAGELGRQVHRVDLSKVVSKYVGETEKNLSRVLETAREMGAVLFFDEADSLFGKRSEASDAHDRYANIEIGYLLEQVEHYDGLVILTADNSRVLDTPLGSRMRFIVDFSLADGRESRAESELPPARR